LLNPEKLEQAESQLRTLLAQPAAPVDHAPRLAQLHKQIANIADAIASGELNGSATLAQRLLEAEREAERLDTARA
jgi:hypothetical protein